MDLSWRSEAPCLNKDYLFFSSKPLMRKKAAKICETCDFVDECLTVASKHNITTGVWGGKYGNDLKEAINEFV